MKIFLNKLWVRFFGNPMTTIIGVLLLMFAMIGLIIGSITFEQFIIFLPTILGLFYVKDSVLQP